MPGVRSFLSANAETSKAKAQIVYYDQGGGIIRIDDSGALGYSGTWKEFTLTSHSPADAATMEIRLTTEDAQGASVLFDGIRLKVPGLEGKYDFTGKKQDEGTGLTYFGARFYDGESCRFVTADTYTNLPNDERFIDDVEVDKVSNYSNKINVYSYCSNNPVTNYDFDGHMDAGSVTMAMESLGVGLGVVGISIATCGTVEVVAGVALIVMIVADCTLDDYSDVANPRTGAKEGGNFTARQKRQILEKNRQKNKGDLRSDKSGKKLKDPKKSKKGEKHDPDEAHVDHKKSKADGGTNDSGNAQVLSREENLSKGSKSE